MAPNAAQSLATLGVSLVLFLHPRRRVAGWLALLVVFESILALIGYLLGTKSLYQVARALRISEYTATGLLLLCIAALAAWPQGTAVHVLVRRTPGGMLARRILPPLIAIPVLLGFLRNAGERAGLYDDALGTALMIAGMLPLVAVLIWFNARSIDRLDEAQRRISAENERLAAEARSAVAARDEFIALAGHELRTPLTALRLRVQLEERRTEGARAAEVQRWIRLVDRLARLVETMLDVTRLASQRLELQRRTLDLQAVVNGTVERLSAVFTAAGTGVQVRGDAGVLVHADPLRIEQAVENILLNAAKYAAGGDVEVLVARSPWTACPERARRSISGSRSRTEPARRCRRDYQR
jgi:signal transduction histidine kinase